MEVKVTVQDGIAVLELAGRMDATTAPEFSGASQTILAEGNTRLIVDMTQLEYVSSAGLREILGLVKRIKALSGKLAFCGLKPVVAEVFRISGFSAIMTVCDSRQDAIKALEA